MSARAALVERRKALLGQPLPALAQLVAEKARRSFAFFFERFAWPVLWPGTRFQNNWHISAICEHLEAVKRRQISKLVISMPFRSLKSSIVSQAFPTWEWIDAPYLQYLTGSYAKDVATRDAVNSRRIIESPEYQNAFGDRFQLTSDQNVKTRYENDKRGERTITSTDGAGTGFGGHRRIVDDPISAKDANSEAAINASIEWWRGTMATRANDPGGEDAVVIVHQRVHQRDLTGYVLSEERGWEHLVLPMRYDPEICKSTSIGFKDPRKAPGELLHPARVSEAAVVDLEKTLGSYHAKAQLQQSPESRGGTIFERKNWKFWKTLPRLDSVVISTDCSFKDLQTSDFVATHVWGRCGADKYLLYRVKDRLGCAATIQLVRTVRAKFPRAIANLIEDKANGSAVIEAVAKEIPGTIAVEPEGGKIARAYAIQPEHEAGNLYLPDPSVDPDIETFIGEAASFPSGPYDDEVDAMTQAINWFRTRGGVIDMKGGTAVAAAGGTDSDGVGHSLVENYDSPWRGRD